MPAPTVTIRPATAQDSDIAAQIARTSRRFFLPYLPDLQTLEGDKRFYRNRVFPNCEVWLAEVDGAPVGFCAFQKDWLDHLYLLPGHVGQSLGRTLLDKAKERQAYLQLWVFQQNERAIRFYQRNGFQLVRETDGAGNEEKTPDALFAWRRPE